MTATSALEHAFAGSRAVVLGGTGFLGSAIARRLVSLGVCTTITGLRPGHAVREGITVLQADLRDREALRAAIRGQDFVFNFAGVSGAAYSNIHAAGDLEVNARGVLNVLEVCREASPSARVIFPGSRLQYGPATQLPVPEDHPMRPTSIYGAHKVLGESYHLVYHHAYGLRTTVLRISNPFGVAGESHSGGTYNVVNRFLDLALRGETLHVFGDGGQARDYIHVDDVVEATLRAAISDETVGQALNLGTGRPTRIRDMAETIVRVTGRGRVEYVPWPEDAAAVETGDFYLDISKLRKAIDWSPEVDVESGVRRSIAWGGR